ncbi:MAG: sugar kinase [Xylanivirga thermophila]|jgi:2-dehydro-3-deoxygluconokinase|uniref:PfkB family carbohydrate kinase n=1 Tax=Xylanivirga thermophila TaxID=2496273 RepID=UPI0039F4E442
MKGNIVTFGEIMLRLTPPGYQRLEQARTLEMQFGGAEANVAASLARWGENASFITKLPPTPIAQGAIDHLRSIGVCTDDIVLGGDRMGLYFLERGAAMRSSDVVYDRANSSIAGAKQEDFNWREIFKDASWFHFTGITPALSDNTLGITMDACKMAKEMGITVSCDVNYRSKLWDKAIAGEVLSKLLRYVDVCIINEQHAKELFNITSPYSMEDGFDERSVEDIGSKIMERFGCQKVAITYRRTVSALDTIWWSALYDGARVYISPRYSIHVVDRVGSGDAFAAGLIYGLANGMEDAYALNFGGASCALKHTIEGDINWVSVEEIEKLMSGDKSGGVKR